jgi:hypothetical protein
MPRLDRYDTALRVSIAANLDLIDLLRAKDPGGTEVEMLILHVRTQVRSLILHQEAQQRRQPMSWNIMVQAAAVAVVTGLALYAMWRPEHWATWLLFLLVAGVGLLLFIGALSSDDEWAKSGAPEQVVVSRDGPFVDLRRRVQPASETTTATEPQGPPANPNSAHDSLAERPT